MQGEEQSVGIEWTPVGMRFPADLGQVRYGLVFTASAFLDRNGRPLGRTVAAGSRVEVLAAAAWSAAKGAFHRLYRVLLGSDRREGWIDGAAVALITDARGALAVGVVPRKIVVDGGDSEYSLLAVSNAGRVTLIDTSSFPFADAFHLSGVRSAAVAEVNGSPVIVLRGETIVSLGYLGATPLAWVAWLAERDGAWSPILLYNESYATDAGYSYRTTMRTVDSPGSPGTVRLDTEYVLGSGATEFRSRTVSFYPWTGSSYRKAPLEDLPRRGTVTGEAASLREAPASDAAVEQQLVRGDELFVFDRADAREGSSPWWYRAISREGMEGWISGADVSLSWIDPLRVNRAVFLGQVKAP